MIARKKNCLKFVKFYRHMVVQQKETKVYALDSILMQIVVKLVSGKIYKIILVNWQQLSTYINSPFFYIKIKIINSKNSDFCKF